VADPFTDVEDAPWRRLPGETEKAYTAFRAYLSQQAPRNYKALAASLGKQLSQIKLWGSKHSWTSRAAAYDAWKDDALDDNTKKDVGKIQKYVVTEEIKHYKMLVEAWEKAYTEVQHTLLMSEDKQGRRAAILDMQRLIRVRNDLSLMARRAAHLPQTYRALPEPELEETDREYYADWEKGLQVVRDNEESSL